MRRDLHKAAAGIIAFLFVFGGLAIRSGRLLAAGEAPEVVVMLSAADELLADGEYLLKLTDSTEQKQWKVLKEYLEVFLVGVDKKMPTQVAIFFDGKEQQFVWSVPVADWKSFRVDNIGSILTPKIREISPDLYKLGSGKPGDFNGYLSRATPYVHFAETKNQNDLNLVPKDPRASLKPLLDRHFAIGVSVQNKNTDAAAQAKRRELFQSTRKSVVSTMRKERGESASDLELRKKAVDIEMDEVEWYFAESEQILAGLSLDRQKGVGRVDLELTPIAGSPLAKSVAELSTKPSYFANVEKSAAPILSARLNHPLNDLRKKSLLALFGMAKDRAKTEVDADAKLPADQKEPVKQLAEKCYEWATTVVNAGLADGFIDVQQTTTGKNLFLGGVRNGDPQKIIEIINLLPKAQLAQSVKLNTSEESGVKIHTIELGKDRHPAWTNLIGADVFYVGTSKDAVWCAAGQGALDALKAAIKKASQPPAAGADKAPWAEFIVRLKPFVEEAVKDLPKKKGEGRYRTMALSAFETGDDQLSVRMTRQDRKIVGEILLQKGLLRFAGKAVADFSKENFDTPAPGAKNPKNAKN